MRQLVTSWVGSSRACVACRNQAGFGLKVSTCSPKIMPKMHMRFVLIFLTWVVAFIARHIVMIGAKDIPMGSAAVGISDKPSI